MNNVFTNGFISSVKSEIEKQLEEKGAATRKSVCEGLGIEGYEACVSVLFETGQLPEYRALKRVGIVSSDHQTTKEKKALKALLDRAAVVIDQAAAEACGPDLPSFDSVEADPSVQTEETATVESTAS